MNFFEHLSSSSAGLVAEVPRVLDAADFARERLALELDPRQEEVLRSTAKRTILNCSRQWGKSTVAAAKAIHRAYTSPGSLILVASPSDRQSSEFLRKAAELMGRLGIAARGDGDNAASLLFPNKSRIVGLPGTEATGRGFSNVSLVVIDEASVVEDSLYKMLRPTLATSGGDLWLLSTPRGKRGFFYLVWAHGGPNWLRLSVPATECPRIPKEHLEEAREQEGMAWFRQEYMCEFVDDGNSTFDRELVERALDDYVQPMVVKSRLTTWLERK